MSRLGLRALGREQVEAPSPVDRLTGLAHRIVDRGRLVAMAYAARQPLRRQRSADDRSAFVEDLHQIMLLDTARGGIFGVEPYDPVVVAVDLDPVVLDVEQEGILAVALSVERVFRVWREHLQREALVHLARMRPLP